MEQYTGEIENGETVKISSPNTTIGKSLPKLVAFAFIGALLACGTTIGILVGLGVIEGSNSASVSSTPTPTTAPTTAPTTTPTTTPAPRVLVVFVTKNLYVVEDDFIGLEGADSICQAAASNASLTGTFKAWLSNTTTSAKQRFTAFVENTSFVDTTGTVIISDIIALYNGPNFNSLDSVMERDEFGDLIFWNKTSHPSLGTVRAFSNTYANGNKWGSINTDPVTTCGDWTLKYRPGPAGPGPWQHQFSNADPYNDPLGWSYRTSGKFCPTSMHFRCFEQ